MSDAISSTYPAVSQATVRDYIELLKPRVMALVVFTAIAGIVVAPGDLHPLLTFIVILCVAMGAGAAGAINMWYERDIDSVMKRTQNRPLPQGRINPDDALAFGITLSIASVCIMGLALNWMAATLLATASLFYIFVYTIWLKRRTPLNIVIGGASGAFPPMIGWAAVTGDITIESGLLFLLIFLWTPPHFWALSLYKRDDYARANIPMMPNVVGEKSTKIQMLLYTLVLFPVSIAPYFVGLVNTTYLYGASILGIMFTLCALKVMRDHSMRYAKQMFGFSIFYLFAIFTLLMMGSI